MEGALYPYLFHYNHYSQLWSAFKRDHVAEYFNGDFKNVIQHRDKEELIELVRIKESK